MDRARIEQRSAVLLVWMGGRPRWLLFLVPAALLAGVVFAPPAAAVPSMVVLVAGLAWLAYLSWPVTDPRTRGLRLLALALLVVLGVRGILS